MSSKWVTRFFPKLGKLERIGRQNGENPRKSRRKRSKAFQLFPFWKELPAGRSMFTSSNSTFSMNYNHRKPPPDPWALYVLAAVGALCFAVVLSMLTGCTTTRTVERVTVHRDTLHIVHRDTLRELRTVRDSVFLHDSVYFEGATLVKERTRDRWHIRRDTVWRSRVDTVRAASHHTDTRNEKKTTHSGFLWPPLSLIIFLAVFGLIGYALKR
nr:MAG TPA: hypothetical protein [Caudoviricetes sp.]